MGGRAAEETEQAFEGCNRPFDVVSTGFCFRNCTVQTGRGFLHTFWVFERIWVFWIADTIQKSVLSCAAPSAAVGGHASFI